MAKKELRINLVPFNAHLGNNSPLKDVTNSRFSSRRKCSKSGLKKTSSVEDLTNNVSPGEELFDKVFHLKPLRTYRPSMLCHLSNDRELVSFQEQRVEDWVKEQSLRVAEAGENVNNFENDENVTTDNQNVKPTRKKNESSKIPASTNKGGRKLRTTKPKNKSPDKQNTTKHRKRSRFK